MPATNTDSSVQPESAYEQWLATQPLSAQTRRTYLGRVRKFCEFVAGSESVTDPFGGTQQRDRSVNEFKTYLEQLEAKPSSINLALSAVDHFYRFLGLGSPDVKRVEIPQASPRALSDEEVERFVEAIAASGSARDRAIVLLLLNTGIRLGECAALDLEDIDFSDSKDRAVITVGRAINRRQVPLNTTARTAMRQWLTERSTYAIDSSERALFISRRRLRLSARSIDLIVRRLGQAADLSLSAHTLRHTCLAKLVRAGHDLVLVAQIAGHRRLETTRRYSVPEVADRHAVMEALV